MKTNLPTKRHTSTAARQLFTQRSGFSLLELLIVLAILAVIAGMVVPSLLGSQKKANISATENSIHGLEQTLKLYATSNGGEYPQGAGDEVFELLMATTDEEGTAVDPILEKLPTDAWGETLYYEYPSSQQTVPKPAIWSSGPNRTDEQGGGDDITNWDAE